MFITLYLYGSMGVALLPTPPPAKFNTPPHPSTNSSVFYHYKDHMNYNQTTYTPYVFKIRFVVQSCTKKKSEVTERAFEGN